MLRGNSFLKVCSSREPATAFSADSYDNSPLARPIVFLIPHFLPQLVVIKRYLPNLFFQDEMLQLKLAV